MQCLVPRQRENDIKVDINEKGPKINKWNNLRIVISQEINEHGIKLLGF